MYGLQPAALRATTASFSDKNLNFDPTPGANGTEERARRKRKKIAYVITETSSDFFFWPPQIRRNYETVFGRAKLFSLRGIAGNRFWGSYFSLKRGGRDRLVLGGERLIARNGAKFVHVSVVPSGVVRLACRRQGKQLSFNLTA